MRGSLRSRSRSSLALIPEKSGLVISFTLHMDWHSIFVPDTPLLEIALRGSIMYLSLFVMLRVILKRQSGDVALSDLLVVVLIADAAQNGMAADYQSIPDGILLVFTIIFWSYALDWLGYHFPRLQRLLVPPPCN